MQTFQKGAFSSWQKSCAKLGKQGTGWISSPTLPPRLMILGSAQPILLHFATLFYSSHKVSQGPLGASSQGEARAARMKV